MDSYYLTNTPMYHVSFVCTKYMRSIDNYMKFWKIAEIQNSDTVNTNVKKNDK